MHPPRHKDKHTNTRTNTREIDICDCALLAETGSDPNDMIVKISKKAYIRRYPLLMSHKYERACSNCKEHTEAGMAIVMLMERL